MVGFPEFCRELLDLSHVKRPSDSFDFNSSENGQRSLFVFIGNGMSTSSGLDMIVKSPPSNERQ